MALGTIPPWLNVSPPDFLRATASGADAGLQAGATVARQRLAQQELAQRAAEIADREQQAREMMQQRAAEFQQESLRQEHADVVSEEYRRQQAALQQQELQQRQAQQEWAMRQAMQKFQAQQQYQQLIQSGVTPDQALMQVGPSLGIPMAGFAQLVGKSVPFTPLPSITQEGRTMMNTGPNRWTIAPPSPLTGVEPLPTAPILDPNGLPIPGRFAFRGQKDRMTPLATGSQTELSNARFQASIFQKRIDRLAKLKEGGIVTDMALLGAVREQFPKLESKDVQKKAREIIDDQIGSLENQIDMLSGGATPAPKRTPIAPPSAAAPAANPAGVKLGSIQPIGTPAPRPAASAAAATAFPQSIPSSTLGYSAPSIRQAVPVPEQLGPPASAAPAPVISTAFKMRKAALGDLERGYANNRMKEMLPQLPDTTLLKLVNQLGLQTEWYPGRNKYKTYTGDRDIKHVADDDGTFMTRKRLEKWLLDNAEEQQMIPVAEDIAPE